MQTSTIKTETFEKVIQRAEGIRMRIYELLCQAGPSTTRELARQNPGISILTLRPRLTELCQLGLVRCVGRKKDLFASEGVYEAVPLNEAKRQYELKKFGQEAQGVLF